MLFRVTRNECRPASLLAIRGEITTKAIEKVTIPEVKRFGGISK